MSAPSPGASSRQPSHHVERPPHPALSASKRASSYLRSLFPFLSWIRDYNSTWLASDLIAGITVGAIVVPQGMAYASLAKLDPEFGLYSSFVGVMIYWLFGTSKDISIGPVAVLSTVVGNLVHQVTTEDSQVAPFAVAAFLSILTGSAVLLMGLLRCGWIVNLVSAPSLAAFMTGSAVTIIVSQTPSILGLTGFSTRESPLKVFLNIISTAQQADLNAVLGLSALMLLYLARFGFTKASERSSQNRPAFQLLNSMRAVSIIILYTLISYLAHWNTEGEPLFDVLGSIPQGFQHFGSPPINLGLLTTIMPYLPATLVVMLVEHMAIGKSFGRANSYSIDPSQEMVAIGVTNLVGPFFGGYPSTGSFSRTAIQSKAGARSPLAGLVTGLVVLLAIHLLTAAFYYIPSAVLAAVIVHAVGDLITPISTLRQYWHVSPMELSVFLVGVVASIAKSIETGLYAGVALSSIALLYRSVVLRTRETQVRLLLPLAQFPLVTKEDQAEGGQYGTFNQDRPARYLEYGTKPDGTARAVNTPCPGVVAYRFSSNLNYINSASCTEELTTFVQKHTSSLARSTLGSQKEQNPVSSENEDLLNSRDLRLPRLKAVVLDFQHVQSIDATAVQQLVDLKRQLDAYALPEVLEFYFTRIRTPRLRKALQSASLVTFDESKEECDQVDHHSGYPLRGRPSLPNEEIIEP